MARQSPPVTARSPAVARHIGSDAPAGGHGHSGRCWLRSRCGPHPTWWRTPARLR